MDDRELRSVQLKRSESFGFGISVFGGSGLGLPPVIYDVADNSPAAFSGQLEAGDVIVEVNDTPVVSFTTKEVLKCLRLANDVVTLKIKKDPAIQERVRRQMMAAASGERLKSPASGDPGAATPRQNGTSAAGQHVTSDEPGGEESVATSSSTSSSSAVARKCELFTMTGDLIITKASSTKTPATRTQSTPASPGGDPQRGTKREASSLQSPVAEKKGSFGVRTSRSDDHLGKARGTVAAVSIDIDDDEMASSLNTLLDTKDDSRVLWTYNAGSSEDNTATTASSSSGRREDNLSELECCTSEMASAFGSEEADRVHASELDLSSPSQLSPENEDGFSREEDWVAEPDLSESQFRHPALFDSSLRAAARGGTRRMQHSRSNGSTASRTDASETLELDSPPSAHSGGTLEEEDDAAAATDEESDADSLRSFHYSPKAVDMPSASRLAKRLFNLEGFKKSDVSRHLSKNNEFARVVAEEYLRFFDFTGRPLDAALRMFLHRFCLIGETQERERVLVHFSKRYLDCNPGTFKSQDAVHTLTCALMLLNTDLHSENVGHKMTCLEFIENLAELNEGENFPKEVLKALYLSIKTAPLEWAVCPKIFTDDSEQEVPAQDNHTGSTEARPTGFIGHNPFLEVPNPNCATEYKKGYVMRKCCLDPGGKRTPLGKRGWKMFCATLRDLVLYLHKDEQGFRKNQLYESLHNSIRIHHSLSTKATDYTKKQHVFRLQTADQAEYLFQTGDAKELQSWIDTLNFVTASLSAPALAGAVGSQKRFQRPLLPVSHTKFNLREQLTDHENRIVWLEKELEEHVANAPEKGAKSRTVAEFVEKESFLQNELKRYRTYAYLLRSKMAQYPELVPALVETSIGEVDEPEQNHGGSHGCANNPPLPSPSRTKQPSHKALPSSPALGLPSSAFSAPAVASSCSPRSSPTAVRNKRIAQDRFSYRTAVQKGGDLGT
nr:PH and SEC7 domain-containing protein-like isoform X1 [Rhipicephalus microplus]